MWQGGDILHFKLLPCRECCILSFVLVIPWRLNFVCRHFRTLCLIFRGRVNMTYEDGTDKVFWNVSAQNSDAGVTPKKKRIKQGGDGDSYFKALFQAAQHNKNRDYRINIEHILIHKSGHLQPSFFPSCSDLRASWIVCTCWDTADNILSSSLLNSSKQPQAPTWHRPTKIRPIAWKSNVSSQLKTSTKRPNWWPRALTDSVLPVPAGPR